MKILLVQESDWLKRNPHQQHHLMERLSLRGHEIVVMYYNSEWGKSGKLGLKMGEEIFTNGLINT